MGETKLIGGRASLYIRQPLKALETLKNLDTVRQFLNGLHQNRYKSIVIHILRSRFRAIP